MTILIISYRKLGLNVMSLTGNADRLIFIYCGKKLGQTDRQESSKQIEISSACRAAPTDPACP